MSDHRKTDKKNLPSAFVAIPMVVSLAALMGCGNTPSSPTPPSAVALLSRSLVISAPDSMHVRDSTYQRISTAFDDHFDLGTATPIRQVEQELPWKDLAELVPKGTEDVHGIRFDYGLDGDSMRFGISVLVLRPTPDPDVFDYTLPDTLYAVGKGKPVPVDGKVWRDTQQYATGDPSVYFSRVRVQHKPGTPFEPVDHAADAHADILAWDDELLPLYSENATGHGDSTFYAVLRCVSKPDDGGALRHRVCVHLRLREADKPDGPYRDLLDNATDKVHPFKMHGADYGNMCPPGGCTSYLRPPR